MQNELAPDNSFLELFPAHRYMHYPEIATASTVEIPPSHSVPLVWAEAYQGQDFLPPALRVQPRSCRYQCKPKAPCRYQNKPLSAVLVSRHRVREVKDLGRTHFLNFSRISDDLWFFKIVLSLSLVATSFEVPFAPDQKLRLSNKRVRHSDSESSMEGKGLKDNCPRMCAHTNGLNITLSVSTNKP